MDILAHIFEDYACSVVEIFLTNQKLNFGERMLSIRELTNEMVLKLIIAVLTHLDEITAQWIKADKHWHVERYDSRSQETVFGTLCFKRLYFSDEVNGIRVHLLDELVGITPRQRVGNDVRQAALENVIEQSYEKSAAASCPQGISRMCVHNILRELDPVSELHADGCVRSIPCLYVEADEDHVALQNGKNAQIKLVYIHEGREEKRGKMMLKNARYLTWPLGGDIDTLWERVADYIGAQYDIDNLKNVFLSGDGARWIHKGEEWLPNCIPILDAYHMNKALTGLTASVPSGKSRAMALLDANEKKGFTILCREILKGPMPANQQKRKNKLAGYLLRNWQRIQNRRLDDALGCSAEGHVSHILSARLSSRPLGWGENNLVTMAQLRVMKANHERISYIENKRPASTPAISHLLPMTPEVHEHIRMTVSKKLTLTQFSLPVLIAGKQSTLYQTLHDLTSSSVAS